MRRREFLLAAGAAGFAAGQSEPLLPDMLLTYFTQRIEAERAKGPGRAVREKLREISGPYPERTPLKPQVLKVTERSGYRIENVVFESRPDFFVNGNLYLPTGRRGPVPAVVMPRGHFDPERMSGDYQQICFDLVTNGLAVLAWDPVGQGERRQKWTEAGAEFDGMLTTALEHALVGNKLALLGESAAGWFIWDGMRAVDYLQSRPEIDGGKIGCADHPDNGAETSLFCAVEERIGCAVLHGPRFARRWPVDQTTWIVMDDTQEYLPNAAKFGIDTPEVFRAMAPRPLLVLQENLESGFDTTGLTVSKADAGQDWPVRFRLETVGWFGKHFGTGAAPKVEKDVAPEMQSVLRTPVGGKSVYAVIREEAAGLPPRALTGDWLGMAGARVDRSAVRILDSENGVDRILIPSEPGIVLPAAVHHPANGSGKVVVYVAGDVTKLDPQPDDDPPPADVTAQKLAGLGYTVLAVDVRGIGATAPRMPRRGFRVPYHHLMNRDMAMAAMAWSLGDSLFAMRVRDVLRAVDVAAGLGDVWLAGRDMGAAWVVCAAALEKRVKGVVTEGGMDSFRSMIERDRYPYASSQIVWGGLRRFDLPEVVAAIAPRPVLRGKIEELLATDGRR